MPRFVASISREFVSTRSTPKVGQTGRRVRDLTALVEHNEPGRGFLLLLSQLLMAAIWLAGCAAAGLVFLLWRLH